jgi:TPR repeat protein
MGSSEGTGMRMTASLILTAILAAGAVVADGSDLAILEDMRARAAQGDPFAQTELGFLHRNGFGVTKDEAQALAWYEEAAKTGFVLALLGLGDIYAEPLGAHSNPARAIMMFSLAAMQGIGVAAERARNLRNSADAADVAEAERLIKAWRREPVGRPYRMPQPRAR